MNLWCLLLVFVLQNMTENFRGLVEYIRESQCSEYWTALLTFLVWWLTVFTHPNIQIQIIVNAFKGTSGKLLCSNFSFACWEISWFSVSHVDWVGSPASPGLSSDNTTTSSLHSPPSPRQSRCSQLAVLSTEVSLKSLMIRAVHQLKSEKYQYASSK